MTIILVPQTAQLKIYGQVGGIPYNVITHFSNGTTDGPWTVSALNAMCEALHAGVKSQFQPQWPNSVVQQGVSAVDLSVSAPQVGTSSSASATGSAAGMQDAAAALMLNFHTADRYRGGHGRAYIPGLATSLQSNATQWTNTAANASLAGWTIAVNNTISAALSHGVGACFQSIPYYSYSYTDDPAHHRYTRSRTGFKKLGIVLSTTVSQQIRTQRRRLG